MIKFTKDKLNMHELLKTEEYLHYLQDFITPRRKARIDEILQFRTKHFTIVVEDVFQLHNTSAVMRSCEVFGIQELQVVEQKFGKTIDSEIALGAQKWVDIYRFESNQNCISNMQRQGYQIIASTPHDDSCYLADFDISKPSAIFFGTEKTGLSEDVIQQADGFLKIPMVGFTESLNISVSAAIVIQQLTERLRKSSISWQLTEEELLLKKLDWTSKSIQNLASVQTRYLERNGTL
jgi:tRNA (guanosine-2'-O-)-methyltransferase